MVMDCKFKKKLSNRQLLSPGYLKPYLDSFIIELDKNGYTKLTVNGYVDSVKHFGTWLHKKNISLEKINDNVMTKFSKHPCSCSGFIRKNKLSRQYIDRVKHFIFYIQKQNIITFSFPAIKKSSPLYLVKFKESLRDRGLSNYTIAQYERYTNTLVQLLGDDPKKYNVVCIRQVITEAAKKNSRPSLKKLVTALKAYLRFLIMEGLCSTHLDSAVPTVAEWRLSSLPKYITPEEVELIIGACDIHTKQGLRDRAIVLLLYRLGLRAGDIINMCIDDIDWPAATLRVNGKGRRETLFPLPQDVGDAVLAYLEKARPPVPIDKLFLCLNAPYRSFPTSGGISSIVSAAIDKANIIDPPSRGAHLLRHSAATHMLRQGATLEAVSAVLRHQSLDMTSYYAKVDVPRLTQIAQPWQEDVLYVK
jgi:integrase/recombinase XerD